MSSFLEPEQPEYALYADLIEYLRPQGHSAFKAMPDGSLSCLSQFIFTIGLVTHVDWHNPYRDRWCYEDPLNALLALDQFGGEGDPIGPWLKYKGRTGERHNPLMYRQDKSCSHKFDRIPAHELDIAAIWPRGL